MTVGYWSDGSWEEKVANMDGETSIACTEANEPESSLVTAPAPTKISALVSSLVGKD